MRRRRLLAIALIVGFHAWQSPAFADEALADLAGVASDQLTLRDRIMVDDDVVRLGDLFQESLSDGDVAVAQAPKAGQTLTLDARFLQQVARAYRLTWKPAKYQKVTIGRMAKRPLKAGQILRQSDVAVSPVIHKNDLIRLVVKTGQMTLSVQGKAMQDAAIGQTVRVMNVNSNRQLTGTVIDAGTVAIGFDAVAIN
jgi:flagella basal body P-ring formation protein FlgA